MKHIDQARLPLLYSAGLGLAAALAIVLVGGFSLLAVGLALVLLAGGVVFGQLLTTQQQTAQRSVDRLSLIHI